MKKYISIPPSPHGLRNKHRGRRNPRRRNAVNGDDAVIIEETFDNEDEETLQQRFQLRSRFSRAGMPHIPVIEKPSSLEASLPLPPRKPRNVARKRTVNKLKLLEATRQEVRTATTLVEYCQ